MPELGAPEQELCVVCCSTTLRNKYFLSGCQNKDAESLQKALSTSHDSAQQQFDNTMALRNAVEDLAKVVVRACDWQLAPLSWTHKSVCCRRALSLPRKARQLRLRRSSIRRCKGRQRASALPCFAL